MPSKAAFIFGASNVIKGELRGNFALIQTKRMKLFFPLCDHSSKGERVMFGLPLIRYPNNQSVTRTHHKHTLTSWVAPPPPPPLHPRPRVSPAPSCPTPRRTTFCAPPPIRHRCRRYRCFGKIKQAWKHGYVIVHTRPKDLGNTPKTIT